MRRAVLVFLAAVVLGCASSRPSTHPAAAEAPEKRCVVCGVELDSYNWYGSEGPFCPKHLEEAIAKDHPKRGLRS